MWCFQGVEKRCIGEEWVNAHWKHQKTSGFMFSGGYKKRSVAWNGLKGSVSKNWSSSSATLKTWDKFNKMSTAEFFEFPSKSSKTYNLFSLVSVTTLLWFIIQFIRNLDQGKSLIWKWRLYHSSQVTTWFKDLWCFFPLKLKVFH